MRKFIDHALPVDDRVIAAKCADRTHVSTIQDKITLQRSGTLILKEFGGMLGKIIVQYGSDLLRVKQKTISHKSLVLESIVADRPTSVKRTFLVSAIFNPSSVAYGISCLAQVDSCAAVSTFACICKITKLMCAKPHRGYLHDAHLPPKGSPSQTHFEQTKRPPRILRGGRMGHIL